MLLVTGGLVIAALLAACSGNPNAGASNNQGGSFVISTTPSVVPAFPSVTMGAWIDNMTPVKGDNDTLYAIIRAQPADMKTAARPVPNVAVSTDTGLHGTTDADGLAAIPFQAVAPVGQPLLIHVFATVNGVNLNTTTFYTTLSSSGDQGTATPKPGHH
jgi:hypothetical protein